MSWRIEKLGSLCTVKTGKKDVNEGNKEGAYPFFTCAAKHTYSNVFSFDCEAILIAGNGAVGQTNYYNGKFEAYQRTYVLCDFIDVLPQYLLYVLNGRLMNELSSKVLGNTIPYIKKGMLTDFEVPVPPLEIQKRIIEKLDTIFIEVDKAIVAAEKNTKNADVLFHSYLSNIGAPLSALGEYVTIKTGKLDSNASVENGIYPFFTCSKEIFSINDYAFDCEAVLLAGNNASGDFNVKHYKGKFNAYQRTYVITIHATDKLTYRYLYYQLINALKAFKNMSVGANTKFLKIGMIKELKFPLPPMDEQIKILNVLEILEKNTCLIKSNYQTRLNLTQTLKKSILQQAFSGELVKE